MKLYDGKSKIIKLFEDKNIDPSNYPYNAKSESEAILEPKEYELEDYLPKGSKLEESEPKEFEEIIAERTKLRRQKKSDEKYIANEFNKLIIEKDKSINKDLIEKHFGFQSLIDIQSNFVKLKIQKKIKKLI